VQVSRAHFPTRRPYPVCRWKRATPSTREVEEGGSQGASQTSPTTGHNVTHPRVRHRQRAYHTVQPFSQKSHTPTVAKEIQIGLYDPTEADLEHFWNCCSEGFLGERLYVRRVFRGFLPFSGCCLTKKRNTLSFPPVPKPFPLIIEIIFGPSRRWCFLALQRPSLRAMWACP